jgi:hypothetical protein
MKPIGRTARKRDDMVVLMPSALGDLGLDFLDIAADEVGDIGDRHAVGHKLVEVGEVHGGPGLAGVDGFQAGRGLLTHTQHEREYRSGLVGIRVRSRS